MELTIRFADGTTVRDSWDGKAAYRIYEFVRAAPVSEVRLDPEGRIALDPDPVNNGWLREPDTELTGDWAKWLGGIFQLLLEGVTQWL